MGDFFETLNQCREEIANISCALCEQRLALNEEAEDFACAIANYDEAHAIRFIKSIAEWLKQEREPLCDACHEKVMDLWWDVYTAIQDPSCARCGRKIHEVFTPLDVKRAVLKRRGAWDDVRRELMTTWKASPLLACPECSRSAG